jgi:hypothetical protein
MNRVQRKRERGYRLPPNTLCVTRGTRWGNYSPSGTAESFREWIRNKPELIRDFLLVCEMKRIEHIACFCPLENECHGDVWIEVWNNRKGQRLEKLRRKNEAEQAAADIVSLVRDRDEWKIDGHNEHLPERKKNALSDLLDGFAWEVDGVSGDCYWKYRGSESPKVAKAELVALITDRDEWKRRAEIAASVNGQLSINWKILDWQIQIDDLKALLADLNRLNLEAWKNKDKAAWSLGDIYQERIDKALEVGK